MLPAISYPMGKKSWWWCGSTVQVIIKTDICKSNTLCGFRIYEHYTETIKTTCAAYNTFIPSTYTFSKLVSLTFQQHITKGIGSWRTCDYMW